jgi:hypothetical protein
LGGPLEELNIHMDGIRSSLGYPGGRSGDMGNEAMAGNMSHGFGSLGYPGGRSGYMGQMDNHAFGNIDQAVNQAPANNGELKAINSKIFGAGTFELPFFGIQVPTVGILILLGALAWNQYSKK